MATCPKQETKAVKDGVVHTAECKTGHASATIRQLDKNTWEVVTLFESKQGTAPVDLNSFRLYLEMLAKNAQTPEQRTEAAKRLAELPRLQAQAEARRAAVSKQLNAAADRATAQQADLTRSLARMAGTQNIHMSGTGREIWTRIADSCASQAKAGSRR